MLLSNYAITHFIAKFCCHDLRTLSQIFWKAKSAEFFAFRMYAFPLAAAGTPWLSTLTLEGQVSAQAGKINRRKLQKMRRMLPSASSFFQNISLAKDWSLQWRSAWPNWLEQACNWGGCDQSCQGKGDGVAPAPTPKPSCTWLKRPKSWPMQPTMHGNLSHFSCMCVITFHLKVI